MTILQSSNPADDCYPIAGSDGTDLATPVRALMIGSAGALKVITRAGNTVTLPSVPAGLFPVAVTRVFATGTTASGIVGIV